MMNNQQILPLSNSQFNYPLTKVLITASQVGTRITVPVSGAFQQSIWLELYNESPYIISIYSLQGILLNSIQPQVCDIAQIPSGDNAFIVIPTILIPQTSPSSEIDINVYPFGQPQGPYPYALNRQAAPVLPSASIGYSASSIVNNTGSSFTALNIFNPVNSGKIYTIYSAQWTQTGGFLVVDMYARNDTIDNNLSGGTVTGTPNHNIGGVATNAHVTFFASSPIPTASNFFVMGALIGNNNYDMIGPPDSFFLHPGQNLMLVTQTAPGNGVLVFQMFKWTEQ